MDGTIDADILQGSSGNDNITSIDGADELNGEEDHDSIDGNNENDRLREALVLIILMED